MFILQQAASERADACSNRGIILLGLLPGEGEKICLMAEILGWQAHIDVADADPEAAGVPARLVLRQAGTVICVEAEDGDVARQLARQGLDRLVMPVPLSALEQLLMFAG